MSWPNIVWHWYSDNSATVNPIFAFIAAIGAFVTAAIGASAALRNARSATQQAEIAGQRRLTETFSKAIEQLGSDKLEMRLGGIYSLERISKESSDDYWAVMRNLTAFVRERTLRIEAEQPFEKRIEQRAYFLWEEAGRPVRQGYDKYFWEHAIDLERLATDVAAILTVLRERTEENRIREMGNGWRLDFRGAVLRKAELRDTHLEYANFRGAHLEFADLTSAHLEGAFLVDTHLEYANLTSACLEGAKLGSAYLKGVFLQDTHLERTDLRFTIGLEDDQLLSTCGDAFTRLPSHVQRPANWPAEAPDPTVPERTLQMEAEQSFEERVAQRAFFLWVEAGQPEERSEQFFLQALADLGPTPEGRS